jgi:hypothetical protein
MGSSLKSANCNVFSLHRGTLLVPQLVEALCYKPEGSIPDVVTGIFH